MKNCKQCRVEILPTAPNYKRKKFCSSACAFAHRASPAGIHERSWAAVVKTDTCWLFQNLEKDGYGYFRVGMRPTQTQWFAHRFAWTEANGPIPPHLMVCHTCDIRNCVNPEHLFLGTQKDNMADCKAKGRVAFGERNKRNKLTEAQAREIMALRGGPENAIQVAARYGVRNGAISALWRGDSWSHLSRLPQGGGNG